MAFCSFGGESDPCGAVQWASHDSLMIPLLSCPCDLSSWLVVLALPGAEGVLLLLSILRAAVVRNENKQDNRNWSYSIQK